MIAKPFVKWAGGKGQLLSQLDELLPKNLENREFTYIEPFVGGGAMLFHMLQKFHNIKKVVINDINSYLVTAYKVIKDNPNELIERLSSIEQQYLSLKSEEDKKQFFLNARELFNESILDDIDRTKYLIFLNRTCFNGLYRVNAKGKFNVPFGRYLNPTICNKEIILADSKALNNVEIIILNGDFEQTINHVGDGYIFFYFDPPYRPLNATSSFTSYSKEDFNDDEQIRLCNFCELLDEKNDIEWMLSNADCSAKNPNDIFFEDLYADFFINRVNASRAINADASKRGKLTELLISNYPTQGYGFMAAEKTAKYKKNKTKQNSMNKIIEFCKEISKVVNNHGTFLISDARSVVKSINDFLYTNYPSIGTTYELGEYREYFSDFHKFWEAHHKEILDCKIDDKKCELVADALHVVYDQTNGAAFRDLYDTCGLIKEDVCRIRFLTANQDFRGSLEFAKLAKIFKSDSSIFDEELIHEDPAAFISKIGIADKSQNDKRNGYAETISGFLLDKGCTPYGLIDKYNGNIYNLRQAIIACDGAGYGNKKTDMFLRDMVVLGVWNDVTGFDKIDVASDVNTIKVALRTGIIKTEIPLVSSFLDIFCYQYSYIETMNAHAWRRVWEIWNKKYPSECIESPCLIDYYVYNVIGKQFCKEILFEFDCETHTHKFMWHSGRNKTCQVCLKNGIKRVKANPVARMMPCSHPEGHIAIHETAYVSSLPEEQKIDACPFKNICRDNRYLQPPKSISILGATGWTTAYARKDEGGGGLMA